MDAKFMKTAIELAKKGNGQVYPNPPVGCVIVKNNKIVGKGWHKYFGADHAEIDAIAAAGDNSKGADLYVTLEPCNSYGKKPPCTAAIVKAGIKRVFYACGDKAVCRGKDFLRKNSVKVFGGLLKKQAELLLKDYLTHLKEKTEVTVKAAMTLDGKIATYKYDSKWISCRQSRDFTHKLRSRYDAVLVGTNTALKDDPFLTAHSKSKQNPIRAVIDLNLKIPKTHHLFDGTVPTVVMYNKRILKIPTYLVEDKIILAGIDVNAAKKDFGVIIKKLNEFSIKKILIEGGSEVMSSAIFSNCVDSVYFFIAPKIIGGKNAVSVIGGTGVQKISQSLRIKNMQAKKIGQDILITGKLK